MGNRQLAKELLHDMQQAERQASQQARTVAATAATAAAPARVATPVGTSRHTPIAAEVIAGAAAAASPMARAPKATPGSGLGPRVAAFMTPQAPPGSVAAASVPPPSTGGGSNTSGLSVPRLKGRGQRRMGPSRLKQDTTAVAADEMEEVPDKENEGGVDVVLPAPQPHSTAKVWRVSLGDAALDGDDEPAAAEAEEPIKVAARATRGRQARGKAVLQEQAARSPARAPRTRRGSKRK